MLHTELVVLIFYCRGGVNCEISVFILYSEHVYFKYIYVIYISRVTVYYIFVLFDKYMYSHFSKTISSFENQYKNIELPINL